MENYKMVEMCIWCGNLRDLYDNSVICCIENCRGNYIKATPEMRKLAKLFYSNGFLINSALSYIVSENVPENEF
jgi:hypothetical protein